MSRRKAEMVLELIDRATGPARRILALQKRMGKATEMANRMAQRSSRMAERATKLYTRATQGLGRAQDALQRGIRRSTDQIRRQVTQMRMATGLMRGGIMNTGRAALLAGGMFAAYAGSVALAGGALMAPARQFEKFQTILTTTEGTAQAAQKAMGWVENFAVKTPYELDQVMASFVQLRAYGLDPTNGMLKSLGNASAAMGKPLMQSVEAIADAVTGENERLKELGIKAAKVGKYFEYTYTGKDGSSKVVKALASDRVAIQKAITGIFDKKYTGAMDMLSKTFDGMVSNVLDIWTKFQRMIMASGVFDWMKGKLSLLLETLNAWEEDGRLERYAKAIGDHIIWALEALWRFGVSLVDTWRTLKPWIIGAKDALGGWRNLGLALLAIPFRGVLFGAAGAFLQVAVGAALAAKAVAGIGFWSMAGGAMHFGKAALWLLNPLNLVRAAFVALRVAIISTGIGALAVGLAMAGLWIYNNWAGLTTFFKGFGTAFMNALGPATPFVEGFIKRLGKLWTWIKALAQPLDASKEQWAEWGRRCGRYVGEFFRSIAEWFEKIGDFDWSRLLTIEGLQELWQKLKTWVTSKAKQFWNDLRPINWGDLIGKIDWLTLVGGYFALATLLRPIMWTAKLLGAPVKWALLGGKFALSGLLMPIKWGLGLISKVPWLALAGGGRKFALRTLVTALRWGSRLIPGIGWAVLAGSLLWKFLLSKLPWSDWIPDINWKKWFSFKWSDLLPKWNWDFIPKLNLSEKIFKGGNEGYRERVKQIASRPNQFPGPGPGPLQARARGGAFNAGWLLTGENGPELEYRTRGGYIAHHRALRNMVAMSKASVRNTALAGSVAVGLSATTGHADATRYLTSKSTGHTTVHAPVALTINGNVDRNTMPELKASIEEIEERIMARLEAEQRAATRREHK